ncbi:MAG: PAS domain-containing protein, partial [Polyangiales bacterium]
MTDADALRPRALQVIDDEVSPKSGARDESAAQLHARLSIALEASQIGVWDLDLTRQSITLSKECAPILGIESPTLESTAMESMIHPDDRAEVDAAFLAMLGGGVTFDREFRLVRPDGEVRWVADRARALPDARGEMTHVVGVVQDITGRKRAEAVLRAQNRVLERIAAGDGLHDVLAEIVEVVEAQVSGARCAVLVLDGERLHHGAAPHLPDAYNRALEGMLIGPMEGCCGAAAFLREVVIAEDIATDPRWATFRDLALPHGLRSCWSTPIVAGAGHSQSLASGRVLGTFALYHDRPSVPTAHEVESVSGAAHLASIAIERDQAERTIRESAERMRQIETARDQVFWICTLPDLNVVYMSPSVTNFLGPATAERIHTRADWSELIHPDDRSRVVEVLQRWFTDPTLDVFDIEFRVLRPD